MEIDNEDYDHSLGGRRPWGSYEILTELPYCKVKHITIDPGQQISVQYHNKRQEAWTIVSGTGQVLIGNQWQIVTAGDTVSIPQGVVHSVKALENPLVFIEVQTGTYFGEDDIVRLEDKYNRL
jgi:mannose-6-phosphate isomerase